MMQEHPFFIKGRVVVLAHRGFTPPAENTIGAIQHALDAGADIIETDVHSSKDGITLLSHDEDLVRLAGITTKIRNISWQELSAIELGDGSKLLRVDEALKLFPNTKFNFDIKDPLAIEGTVKAIENQLAHDRVLVSSFSNKTRKKVLSQFSKPVATSADAKVVLTTWLMHVLGKRNLSKQLQGIGALQIPTKMFGIKLDSQRFISKVLSTNTQIHYWTINDASEMRRLVSMGANGIVTDNTSLAIEALGKTS